ncbi:class I adenylate-forming enzyme family protein [Mycobacterium intracellulare]|uniref:class I adenylate-forming enzyme family protein n=1 Tax=Mycobacterium intracellulare TaxID=1767 RepID=UPI00080B4319|nr:class I adenylate-forming enzyme family protein [Mycobacterium intracellulare]OCB27281.1 AMP-dependent synthetase [Mycobacterium intracellulare subsp. yongonense]
MRVQAALPARAGTPLLERTVGGQLRVQAARFADRPALMWAPDNDSPGSPNIEVLTYHELLIAAEALAVTITHHAQPGDRVAVWAANRPEWVIVEFASALAGTVLTPFNPAWTDSELEHAMRLTAPRLLFAGTDTRGIDLVARAHRFADNLGACVATALTAVPIRPKPVSFEVPRLLPESPFVILFTSGTTGRPKGATLSHRAALNAGYIRALSVHADETDVWFNPVPLHHMSGSVVIVLSALSTGGCYVVLNRFMPASQLGMMRATGATRIGGVPTMFHALLEIEGVGEALGKVKSVGLGGSLVPPELVERLQRYGASVSVAYAQTECPMVTQSDPTGDAHHVATTVGIPVPHTEIRVVGADGSVVERGDVGELCVRSPLTMLGYWDMPAASAEAFDPEQFLHTGDLASIDHNGVVRIHGRARELIIRGGENIYPVEVEQVLQRHPAVDAVAVVGTPHDRWGQQVAAVVKLVAPGAATIEDLQDCVRQNLAYFKVPEHWRLVEQMPMTASGKVRKGELPQLFFETSE